METKRAKVILLPTDNPPRIGEKMIKYDKPYSKVDLKYVIRHQIGDIDAYPEYHLYFITDDEIKEGDWFLMNDKYTEICKELSSNYINHDCYISNCKKIVATTDTSLKVLNKYSNKEGILELLPQPSQAFIEKYCKVGGIDEVMVEVELVEEKRNDVSFIMKEVIKVDPIHNTITIHPIKDSWNREEVEELIVDCIKDIDHEASIEQANLDNWIEENL